MVSSLKFEIYALAFYINTESAEIEVTTPHDVDTISSRCTFISPLLGLAPMKVR